jgi:P-type Cu+ transporter
MVKDPVCGMQVDEKQAKASAQHQERTFFFCSTECRQQFLQEPDRYARQSA